MLLVVGLRGNQQERRAGHRTSSDKRLSSRLKGFLLPYGRTGESEELIG